MNTTVVNVRTEQCDVYIGRRAGGWPNSKWGNPFRITRGCNRTQSVEKYEEWIRRRPELLMQLGELRGKRLGCWCKPAVCHGDVLIQLLEEFRNE